MSCPVRQEWELKFDLLLKYVTDQRTPILDTLNFECVFMVFQAVFITVFLHLSGTS